MYKQIICSKIEMLHHWSSLLQCLWISANITVVKILDKTAIVHVFWTLENQMWVICLQCKRHRHWSGGLCDTGVPCSLIVLGISYHGLRQWVWRPWRTYGPCSTPRSVHRRSLGTGSERQGTFAGQQTTSVCLAGKSAAGQPRAIIIRLIGEKVHERHQQQGKQQKHPSMEK